MTSWALIYMICVRGCTPQYVVEYPTQQACQAELKPSSWTSSTQQYCVPIVRTK